jgi:hypothetical protein
VAGLKVAVGYWVKAEKTQTLKSEILQKQSKTQGYATDFSGIL